MNIVCATDNNFVQHCSIMVTSLLMNNKDATIYVLTEGLTLDNTRILEEEAKDKGGELIISVVDSSIIDKFPLSDLSALSHISKATYYRLLMADILPETVEKVIYLDCDIVVNGSLEELWNTDLSEKPLAAVLQLGSGSYCERLGYPIQYGYFNAGVNLMNLDYCRKHDLSNKFIKYIEENHSSLKYNDQDVLNVFFYDKCIHLMPQWNMTPIMFDPYIKRRGDRRNGVIVNGYWEEKKNAIQHRKDANIIHYVAKPKPWDKNCVHPLYNLYYEYASKTVNYKHLKPQNALSRSWAMLVYQIRIRLSMIKQKIHKTDTSLL